MKDQLLKRLQEEIATLDRECDDQGGDCTWGARNAVQIRHPLSSVLPPWLARRLDMPVVPMSGDNDMPHVHLPGFGASERFAVSPGHEAEGILHMPGGQSGHPLSPFYRAGHEAWVRGQPMAFLPGRTGHMLELRPSGR